MRDPVVLFFVPGEVFSMERFNRTASSLKPKYIKLNCDCVSILMRSVIAPAQAHTANVYQLKHGRGILPKAFATYHASLPTSSISPSLAYKCPRLANNYQSTPNVYDAI
ncbi:hypothetical protein DPSP01_007719 [Paraphaeosphaeria sporulosa]